MVPRLLVSGTGEPWSPAQVEAYDLGTAAILRHLGLGVDRVKAHRETDPRRKPDPTGLDMNAARTRVAYLMRGPVTAAPRTEEPEVITADDIDKIAAAVWARPVPATGSYQPAKLVLQDIFAHARKAAGADVDEHAIAAAVVAGLDPTLLAAAITEAGIAEAVKTALREGTG